MTRDSKSRQWATLPKNKRLKKQRLDDYKNLNWKLFKMHPKEKGKRAAEPDFPNKVSLLTSSLPFAIPVSGCTQSWCQPCLMSPLTQVPPGVRGHTWRDRAFRGSCPTAPHWLGQCRSWDWWPPTGWAPALSQQCHRASSSSRPAGLFKCCSLDSLALSFKVVWKAWREKQRICESQQKWGLCYYTPVPREKTK